MGSAQSSNSGYSFICLLFIWLFIHECFIDMKGSNVRNLSLARERHCLQCNNVQDHSHDPISRIQFLLPKIRSLSDFKIPFLSAPFIFQQECRMKIERALFPSVFSK